MFYFFMDFAIVILEIICVNKFFDIFQNKDEIEKQRIHSKILIIAIMSILCHIVAQLLIGLPIIRMLVEYLLIVWTITFLRGVPCKKSIVLTLLFEGILSIIEYLGLLVVQMMIPDIENMDATQEAVGRVVIIIDLFFCYIVVLLIGRIFKAHKNQIVFNKEWFKYILFPIVTVVMLGAVLIVYRSEKDLGQMKVLCGIGLGLVVMNFLIFYLLEDVIRHEEAIREMESFEIQGKNQLEMYKKITENHEIQKTEIHEFKNHLTCIQSLAESHKYEELRKYVITVNGEMLAGGIAVDTNNDIINAVINTKYQEAVKKHIVVVFRVNDLSSIKMEDRDLVVLVSNLLNNAIEASEKCEKNRVIKIKFIQEYGDVFLSVKNNYTGSLIPVEEGFLTTKNTKTTHGVGIKNAIKVIKKYNGTYDISTENEEFFFSVLIPECAV